MKTYHLKRDLPTTTTDRSTGTSSTCTTTTHGRNSSRIVIQLESLKELYYDAMQRPAPSFITREIEMDLQRDSELMYAYYAYALRETAMAPRPSWKYTQAIMGRLIREKTPLEAVPLW